MVAPSPVFAVVLATGGRVGKGVERNVRYGHSIERLCPRAEIGYRTEQVNARGNAWATAKAPLPTLRDKSRRAGEEMRPQHLAPGAAGLQVKRVDDGETKAAGRHGVALGFLVLVKCDLHARDAGQVPHLCRERGRRVAVAWAMRPEQHHAVSVAPVLIGEVPAPLLVEAHERIDPAGPVEIRPLIAHAQMHLDHTTADGLGVEDAGVALEMRPDPRAAIRFDAGVVRGVHGPMIEGAFPAGLSCRVAPPARLAVDDRDVRTEVAAIQERHPHVPGRKARLVVRLRGEHAARDSHALEVGDGLGEHGKARRRHAVRSGIETLAQRDRDLVVDPAMIRVPKPGVAVFGRNVHVRRTGGAFEILQAPRIGFADRHKCSIRLEHSACSPDPVGWAKARAWRAVPTKLVNATKDVRHASLYPPYQKGRQRSSNVSAWIEKFAPASVHVAAGVHPDPRAKAVKYSSVYL